MLFTVHKPSIQQSPRRRSVALCAPWFCCTFPLLFNVPRFSLCGFCNPCWSFGQFGYLLSVWKNTAIRTVCLLVSGGMSFFLRPALVNHGDAFFTHGFCQYMRLNLMIWQCLRPAERELRLSCELLGGGSPEGKRLNLTLERNFVSIFVHIAGVPFFFSFCRLWRYECLALWQSCSVESLRVPDLAFVRS